MISVDEALEKVLQAVAPLGAEAVSILDSLGQVLAEDITSDVNVPPRDNAAMDGYAVRARDISGTNVGAPKHLRVIGTVMAGAIPAQTVAPGTAMRIMTGAPMPAGADCVVPFEDTDEEKQKKARPGQPITEIGILVKTGAGANIRRAGEDMAKGTLALGRGTVIRPAEIGLLASLGHSRVKAIRRPVVAVLATGNELVDINQPLPEGKIYDSNTYSIAGLVKRYGAVPRILGIALDSRDSLMDKLRNLESDMLLTIGGVSMGDLDVVRDVLEAEGEMVFWKVRMRPGKPLAFGRLRGRGGKGREILHFALPGNPVSCMVSFEVFVRPALLKMMGKNDLAKPMVEAEMEESVKNSGARRIYDRVIVARRNGHYYARLTGSQGSGVLTSMSRANGLAIIPEDRKMVNKGEAVQVMMLDWPEEAGG